METIMVTGGLGFTGRHIAAPAICEAECTTSETHRWGARDAP
jgi:nucleoside-diphosphate-sugar epimerase